MKWFLVPVIGSGSFDDPYRARCADIPGLKTECKGNLGSVMLCQVTGDLTLMEAPDVVEVEAPLDLVKIAEVLGKTEVEVDFSKITTREDLSLAIVEKQATYIHKRTRG